MERKIRSKGELIDELEFLYYKLKKIPSTSDIDRESKKGICASRSTYSRRFGGYKNAVNLLLKKLGMEQLTLV